MQPRHLTGGATIGVGLAMIANALLGPLATSVIRFHESASMEAQLIGGELVSLCLAGPLAIVAGLLWWRGSARGPALALAPLGYALYMNIQFVLVPDYARYPGNNERAFTLYLLVIVASWVVGYAAWRELKTLTDETPSAATRLLLGGTLIGANLAIALAWWAGIAGLYARGPSAEYQEHPTAFWLVRLMDLGLVLPLGTLAGMGLLAKRDWAVRLAYACGGTQALLACAVASMAIRTHRS